jgi:predicted permease
MDAFRQDLRLAFRSIARRPGFTLIAVASLAIGIGVNSGLFSLLEALLLQGIRGVEDPDRIVEIYSTGPGDPYNNLAFPDLVDLKGETRSFEALAGFEINPVSLSDDEAGERLLSMNVTSGYFEVMGVEPLLGRWFVESEDEGIGDHPVTVLSYALWRDRFGSDPDVLGRTIRLNREVYTIVGVAPESFRGHLFAVHPSLWAPVMQDEAGRASTFRFEHRGSLWIEAVGRLREGVSIEEANAELATLSQRLAAEYPESNEYRSHRADPSGLVPASGRGPIRVAFGLISALLLLVLAATCANVAGMLMARAAAEERSITVRMALGSTRRRAIQHMIIESMVIFAGGAGLGVLLAMFGVRFADPNRFLPVPFPIALELGVNGRLLAYVTVLTLVAAIVFGALPALKATARGVSLSLRDSSGGGQRASGLRRLFVAGQVGISILLLATGGLFLRSIQNAGSVDPGFDDRDVYVTSLDLALEGARSPEEGVARATALLEQMRTLPGVTSAAVTTDLPQDGGSSSTSVLPVGREAEGRNYIQANFAAALPGYFETLDIALQEGRAFNTDDGATSPRVIVVNRIFADAAWPAESGLGRQVTLPFSEEPFTVIGIVDGTRADLITDEPGPQVYTHLSQYYRRVVHLAAKAPGAGPSFAPTLRQGLLAVDPSLALEPIRALDEITALGTLPHRIAGALASTLGLLALLLSAIGVYGVVAFAVTQRTREIGVRMALGATRASVIRLIVRGGLSLALPGIVVGAILAGALAFGLRALLVGVQPLDPVTFGGMGGALMLVVMVASVIPARKAARIEPVEALRSE